MIVSIEYVLGSKKSVLNKHIFPPMCISSRFKANEV